LVIPGDDLLEMRALCADLQPQGCYIRYLGFNEAHGSNQSGTRIHVANNEVTWEYGPYHLVNLDLCDSLFPTGSGRWQTYLSALHQLAIYQMKFQTTPWLLFITSQVEPGAASMPDLEKFCQPINKNCDSFPEFASHFATLFRSNPCAATEGVDLTSLDEEEMLRVFGVALGKLLIAFGTSASPNWAVQMLRSYRYRINSSPHVEMLSLAFQFRPKHQPPIDPTGLSGAKISLPSFPTELECARKLVTAVERITDVDQILTSDAALREEMLNSSADLLGSAGYDRNAYVKWVADGEQS
jgi:hypothetical protein